MGQRLATVGENMTIGAMDYMARHWLTHLERTEARPMKGPEGSFYNLM